jgi:hypothetical protein
MKSAPPPADARSEGGGPDDSCCAGQLFDQVWLTMVDVLGGPATATLLRRSIKRASAHQPDLGALLITRAGFDYAYQIPAGWRDAAPAGVASLRALALELTPILLELTGDVVVRRLDAVPELRRCEISFQERK